MEEATGERVFDRKTFLRKGPWMFLGAVAEGVRGAASGPAAHAPAGDGPAAPLRPPGAAREEEFLALCCGLGACAEACPADAIRLRPRPADPDHLAPIIVPAESPCIMCEELACMKACPSGALTPLPRGEVRIGRARVRMQDCLAWARVDPGCDYCADRCPLGGEAIAMVRGARARGPVVGEGCSGCGVCEFYCPAQPAAIFVTRRDS